MAVYKELLKEQRYDPSYIYYRMAKVFEIRHDYNKARDYYWKSVEDHDSTRPNLWQNYAIRELALKHDVALNDTLANFEKASPNAILGYELFRDAHHPDIQGYIIMSNGFSEKISEIYSQGISRKDLLPKELFRHFGYFKRDFFDSYISSARWFIMKARDANFPGTLYSRAFHYLARAEERINNDPEIFFWRFLVALLSNDDELAKRYYTLLKDYDMEQLIQKGSLYPEMETRVRAFIKDNTG